MKIGIFVRNKENYIFSRESICNIMIKVKTFTQKLEIFKTKNELDELDKAVNEFIKENDMIKNVISVSDSTTSTEGGETIGIIRVLTYEE